MITRMNHVSIYVLNQERAYDFYVNKLGFKVHTDAPMGNCRWITVCPPEQPELEISLMDINEQTLRTKEAAEQMADLVRKGSFGFGVFQCKNLMATYEEMKAKGVEFVKEPTKEFYGFAALFKDDSGKWFSLGEQASQ